MSDDVRDRLRDIARCFDREAIAEAENDEAWIERDRVIRLHATSLYHTLERILATTPGTVERAQAEICGHNLIRRIGREP